jgi:hypothetical protein
MVLIGGGERKVRLVLVVAGGDSVASANPRDIRAEGQKSGVLWAAVEVWSRRHTCVQRVCSGQLWW